MKKLISTFILVFMLATLLVGCMPSENNADDNGNQTADNNAENSQTENDDNSEGKNSNESSENPDDEGSNENDENADEPTNGPKVGTEVGDLFASLNIKTLSGEYISPDDYRGKIVIINIWATWCPPCKEELPDFNRIADEYADDVVIIAAHTQSGNGAAPNYVNTNFPDTKIIFAYDGERNEVYTAAGGDGYVPYTAILDRNGVIIYSDSGMLTYKQLTSIIINNNK